MAEYGEWNLKGATLSKVTAKKVFGVTDDFITKGIRAGKLEYRYGSVWGNPFVKLLRRQLEAYIAEELGSQLLLSKKAKAELTRIQKQISGLGNWNSKLHLARFQRQTRLVENDGPRRVDDHSRQPKITPSDSRRGP